MIACGTVGVYADQAVAQEISTITNQGGGKLTFGPGVCLFTMPIQLPSNVPVILEGQGVGVTVLRATQNMGSFISGGITNFRGGGLRDLTIDGSAKATRVVFLPAAWQFNAHDVRVMNAAPGGANVWIGDGAHNAIESKWSNFTIDNPTDPAKFPAYNLVVNGTDNHFTDFEARNATDAHVLVQPNANGTYLTNAHVYSYNGTVGSTAYSAPAGFVISGVSQVNGWEVDSTGLQYSIHVTHTGRGSIIGTGQKVFGAGPVVVDP